MTYSNGLGNGLGNLQSLTGTAAANDARKTDGASQAQGSEAAESVARGQDQTQFSALGGSLGQALSGPDVRAPRVAELSAAIASGTYRVSSSDVAGKMIEALSQ